MTEKNELDAALKKLEKATQAIRTSQHGRLREIVPDVNGPDERIDRVEDALFAIEDALKALKP